MEVDFRIYNCTFFALLSNPFSPVVLIRRMMMEKGGKAAVWVDAWKFEKIFAVMKEIGAIEKYANTMDSWEDGSNCTRILSFALMRHDCLSFPSSDTNFVSVTTTEQSCSFGFLFDHFVKPRLRFRELKE
ncbi:hypothetical protein ACHQM5_010314 [Ranunculus cassubicifolius]